MRTASKSAKNETVPTADHGESIESAGCPFQEESAELFTGNMSHCRSLSFRKTELIAEYWPL